MSRRSRRGFELSGLVAGLLFLGFAAAGGCDAAGLWHPEPLLAVPALSCGLVLVAVARVVANAVRRRRAAATAGSADAPSFSAGGRR